MRYFRKDGKEISQSAAEALYADDSYRVIVEDMIGRAIIRTWWLGGGTLANPRATYETSVSGSCKLAGESGRAETEAEAREVHERFCKRARESECAQVTP